MAFKANSRKGFSLIVVAAILAVAAILIVVILPNDSQKHADQIKKTNDKITAIQKAVKIFQSEDVNNSLPCPARFDQKTGDQYFGLSYGIINGNPTYGSSSSSTDANCYTAAANITYRPPSTTVVIGSVPTKTLGLPDDDAFDEWGNRLTYVINSANTNLVTNSLGVKDLSNNYVPGIEALIISHGPDGVGAWPRNPATPSTTTPTCSLSGAPAASELQNCNYITGNYTNFIKDNFRSFYDDLVGAVYGCPAGVGDCSLWLDADDSVTQSSGAVSLWKDKSGAKNNAIVPAGAGSPTYLATGSSKGNLPAINFAGSPQYMSTLNNIGISGNMDRTIFFAAVMPQEQSGVIYLGNNSSVSPYTVFAPIRFNNEWFISGYFNDVETHVSPDSAWHIHSVAYNKGIATWYLDGALIANQSPQQYFYNTTAAPLMIGNYPNIMWLPNTVSEIATYPKALSVSDQQKVECYLSKKWNIPTSGCHCPAGLLGCTLWLDASDIGDVYHNTGATQPTSSQVITTWYDKSGGARNATATSSQMFQPTGFNSTKPSVHFDASSSNYMTLASTLGHPANWTSFSIVSRPASADHMITLANATNGDRPYSIFLYASGSPTGPVYAGDGNSGAYYTDSATGPIVWSSQSNVANKSIWKNGTSQAPLISFGGTYYADFNALGARPGNGEYSTGDMAEVVFYPTQLADIDRKKIECYEAQKWGLCSTLNGGNAATYCTGVGAKNDAGVLTAYCGATTP